MKDLTLVIIGKDLEAVCAFDMGAIDLGLATLVFATNEDGAALGALANVFLDSEAHPSTVFGLCHADAIFRAGSLEAFTIEAMRGAVCGIVGRHLNGDYVSASTLPRGRSAPPVSTLDGMAVFFRRDLGLRFDSATFDGFHCHVEDLCLQAHAKGIEVTVPAADACHRNHDQPREWLIQYQYYRRKLERKWAGTEFATT